MKNFFSKVVLGVTVPILFLVGSASLLIAEVGVHRIQVVGSTTVLPIATKAAEAFTVDNKGAVIITVNSGGSGVGIHSTASGRADIGMASREISPREWERFKDSDLKSIVVGRDAVACVVSSEVYAAGVRTLSREQIRDIYLGKTKNWKELGGPDRQIVVIDKERHRGTRHVFMKFIMGNENARAPAARLVTGSNNEEQTKIAQSDAAIGMLSLAWINQDVAGVAILENGKAIEPTLENVRNNRFPISRNLNFVVAGEPKGLVKEFIDFVLSPKGQKIVEETGYVSIYPK